MISVESWAHLGYDPCSPYNTLVAVGYHLSAALCNILGNMGPGGQLVYHSSHEAASPIEPSHPADLTIGYNQAVMVLQICRSGSYSF